jgi:hypothetical protein
MIEVYNKRQISCSHDSVSTKKSQLRHNHCSKVGPASFAWTLIFFEYSDNCVMMVVMGNVGARAPIVSGETGIGTSSQQTFDHTAVTILACLKASKIKFVLCYLCEFSLN